MTEIRDPVVDTDLDAYVDDQLDAGRRIEVEAYLSGNPETAARVMSDLRARGELRLALAGPKGMARPATGDAARRLERGLARRRLVGSLQRVAAIAVFVGVGWMAHAGFGPLVISEVVASTPPPDYVNDAVMSHRTTALRASMASQPAVPDYDPDEIRAATAIVMPGLPKDWQVADVQLFPSKFGPSVEMAIKTEKLGAVSLFAVRPGTFDVVKPTVADMQDVTAAYFQIGEVAYALVAKADALDLDRAASQLSDTLY
ncbi:anti-sigma factor [Mesorhizobium sp. YR577]|uniref:anti-sigma factor family protein n=1 Tax=Mesorhizobium sp. YR577 TaxID=1884373 RepID=UPI0008E5CACD|nr:anti-sigma factor [Mesorhizobium sp. YR577]SFU22292.1 Transmembrane transcriptional regulator (anti-sigma factor RsiW) [Mesorhizobium sp. YR577]